MAQDNKTPKKNNRMTISKKIDFLLNYGTLTKHRSWNLDPSRDPNEMGYRFEPYREHEETMSSIYVPLLTNYTETKVINTLYKIVKYELEPLKIPH